MSARWDVAPTLFTRDFVTDDPDDPAWPRPPAKSRREGRKTIHIQNHKIHLLMALDIVDESMFAPSLIDLFIHFICMK